MAMDSHLEILRHSLGLGPSGEGRASRNHFVAGAGSPDHALCVDLATRGLMVNRGASALTGGGDCFVVTQDGIDHVARQRPPAPTPTRSQRNYQRYLEADSGMRFGEWLGARAGREGRP
jgi:hypothetical protein